MQPASVEPALDPSGQITGRVGSGLPAAPVHELTLERAEKRLGRSIIPAHPGRAHRLDHTQPPD